MTTRVLPRSEYFRLLGTELEGVRESLPDTAGVLTVEDDDGELVGCLAVLPIWHAECVWVSERERRRGRVLRRLRTALREYLSAHGGGSHVAVGVTKAAMRDIVTRLGGKAIRGEQFVLPVGK